MAKYSLNSSKPPSSDPPFGKPPARSQRNLSGCKPAGQKGHRRTGCALEEEGPDQVVIVPLGGCCPCGRCQSQITAEVLPERRQVIELP